MKLYKYLSEERLDVLTNGKIRFSYPRSVNDPFESSMMIGDYELDLKKPHERHDECRKKMTFLSLSRNKGNLLMWSHYAASHTGFCIEFNRKNNFFSKAQPVIYRRERGTLNGYMSEGKLFNLDKTLLQKPIDWAYEEEERIFASDLDFEPMIINNDIFGESINLMEYPIGSIDGVYLGLRSSDKLKERISEKLLKISAGKIKLYKAETDSKYYQLKFQEVLYA
ncbi:DUF2971 domain-containing protein [Pseudoalteromonas sp. SWN166]|uniref:DUF2971 domain-containing protein n=1 Tax=Pseudoalteromonas sp. SWN166 TaxID=2792061 RepID=UPI0018CFD05F|nr:DUF2971 domain-containing protein [Pseudoalteromonas sp. SWN166]MBH0039985.1 DUF2971 domain-containing protein [Pseudoalteromonas sp. SWN166]